MQPLKLRLIEAGSFVSILGAVLFVARGYSMPFLGVLVLGMVVLVVGLLWPKPKAAEPPRKEME